MTPSCGHTRTRASSSSDGELRRGCAGGDPESQHVPRDERNGRVLGRDFQRVFDHRHHRQAIRPLNGLGAQC